MIARHVDDGLVQPLLQKPFEPAFADAYVTGRDDDIGVGLREIEVCEFGVQITQDASSSTDPAVRGP